MRRDEISRAEVMLDRNHAQNPPGFRVLCFNCNYAEFRGGCPHKKARLLLVKEVC
jgi:hypothetical protein